MIKTPMLLIYVVAGSLSIAVYAGPTGYPAAMPNHNLEDELKDQTDRKVPKIDWFSAAVDGESYARALGRNDFYHGVGYWVQARTEFRPNDSFRLNVRSVFYSGSFSGGPTEPTGFYNLFGFYGRWPRPILGWTFEARAIDIERQTIGEGLLIEQKEMAGLWGKWTRDTHSIKVMWDGTGALLEGDDLVSGEISLFNGLIGVAGIWWKAGDQSGLLKNRVPAYSVTSTHPIAFGVDYFIEAGLRNSRYAGLLGFKTDQSFGRLRMSSRVQGRYYENLFGDQFVGLIENMYVSYDQYDKRYTNAANVFVKDDDVSVYSLVLDFDYEFNSAWHAHSRNEIGQFVYRHFDNNDFYFYRVGVSYFPVEGRREAITAFASNKVLTESYSRPPAQYSYNNVPLFREFDFIGVEASFRF